MRLAIVLALTVSLGLVKAVTFDSAALKQYTDCGQLSKDECLTWHEAQDKCPTCGGGSSTTPQAGSTPPAKSGKKGKGGKGGKGGGKCFHGDDSVMTNFGYMKIKDMVGKSDLQVLSRSDDNRMEMSPVISWLHIKADKSAEFVQLTTESGHEIRLTPIHLIYETDCNGNSKTIFANKVVPGRCVFINNNGAFVESKVVTKTSRTLKGIYAPVTANGNVVVNNVLASCFTEFENESLQKVIFSSLNSLHRMLSQVMPTTLIDTILNTPFKMDDVKTPQLFLSFIDLINSFVK